MSSAPDDLRVRTLADRPEAADGEYVLYWMTAFRRPYHNFALDRAVDLARRLGKPVLVFEPLRAGYRWASERFHRFVVEGMRANAAAFATSPIGYFPYLEPEAGAGSGLLEELAKRACAVVGDDHPGFFLPALARYAAARMPVKFEAVDSNGLLPLRAAAEVFELAHSFRRFLHRRLPPYLERFPYPVAWESEGPKLAPKPTVAAEILERWPALPAQNWESALAKVDVDRSVSAVPGFPGGWEAGRRRLHDFLDRKLEGYPERRGVPDEDGGSGLSPYLHFGFISTHEIFAELARREKWKPEDLATKPTGSRAGWWNMSEAAESFLDELVTWREVGFNMAWQRRDYEKYASLPEWARRSLAEHAGDPRPAIYSLEQLEAAETYDELWNAAQRQLVREGRIHNYLRMLWGKRVIEWTESPETALEHLIELNNKYALDGRDPNSYSGIFWVFGRYDRAWGPERPIYGKIRYMSSENTARKTSVKGYLRRFGPESPSLFSGE
ncbi:MAG TPA: deoxyribodipyrimidine photolyase [Planctomycetia bacterium]|nr:deoxyribodipyrimidine photolyase [Planctomycetia bacterium]